MPFKTPMATSCKNIRFFCVANARTLESVDSLFHVKSSVGESVSRRSKRTRSFLAATYSPGGS